MKIEYGPRESSGIDRPAPRERIAGEHTEPRDMVNIGGVLNQPEGLLSLAQALKATATPAKSAELAKKILNTPEITLRSDLPSGNPPRGSDSLTNIVDTSEGKPALRSDYGTAPGGSVPLDKRMLNGMLELHDKYGFSVRISSIAGGSHSKNSFHYSGTAFDIDRINDIEVSKKDGLHDKVMAALKKLGAIEILGPGNANHDHHIHVAWSRADGNDEPPNEQDQLAKYEDGY
ncbi:MAG: hypothetical protein RDV48_27405 [Candidatus Eremiobacteraeota bacterium]|nr:hypothetical protein [Candidatus Eremiobacteraeota bacterium]